MKLLGRRRVVAQTQIADPQQHTTMDRSGAVRSIQAANVDLPEAELEAIWSPMHLERLARTYWKYLSRISLGLIRVHYGPDERAVVFITRPFVLLRFHPPEYEMHGVRGIVRWRIRDGILVARRDDGYLEIDVRRMESPRPGWGRVHVEVEVANFYPALARPFKWFYVNTQSRIHVIVTHGFLRSLARLELEESAVGLFKDFGPALPANGHSTNGHTASDPEDVTVGDTPWAVVAALAAGFFVAGALVALRLRRSE